MSCENATTSQASKTLKCDVIWDRELYTLAITLYMLCVYQFMAAPNAPSIGASPQKNSRCKKEIMYM